MRWKSRSIQAEWLQVKIYHMVGYGRDGCGERRKPICSIQQSNNGALPEAVACCHVDCCEAQLEASLSVRLRTLHEAVFLRGSICVEAILSEGSIWSFSSLLKV